MPQGQQQTYLHGDLSVGSSGACVQGSDAVSRLQSASWQALHPLACLVTSRPGSTQQASHMAAIIGKAGAEAPAVPSAALLPLLHALRSPPALTSSGIIPAPAVPEHSCSCILVTVASASLQSSHGAEHVHTELLGNAHRLLRLGSSEFTRSHLPHQPVAAPPGL